MSSYEEETKKLKNPYHTTLKQYASVSTAHGISYIFEDGRFFLERIVWAAVVVAALAFAICMSISAFHNWKDNPVLTSVKTTGLPIEKIEFPAITICSQGSANEIIDAALFQQFKRYESKKVIEDKSFEKLSLNKKIQIFLEDMYPGAKSPPNQLVSMMSSPGIDPSKGIEALTIFNPEDKTSCSPSDEKQSEDVDVSNPIQKRSADASKANEICPHGFDDEKTGICLHTGDEKMTFDKSDEYCHSLSDDSYLLAFTTGYESIFDEAQAKTTTTTKKEDENTQTSTTSQPITTTKRCDCSWAGEDKSKCGRNDGSQCWTSCCDTNVNDNCNGGSKEEVHNCCTKEKPCGIGQGDCKKDDECEEDLVCGDDNCDEKFLWDGADCCTKKKNSDGSNGKQKDNVDGKGSRGKRSKGAEASANADDVCPEGFVSYKGGCYNLIKKYKKWAVAEKTCNEIGTSYHLVAINNNEENEFLLDYIKSKDDLSSKTQFWIGLKRSQNEYTWTDGTQLELGNDSGEALWQEGQPDKSDGTCVRFSVIKKWHLANCTKPVYFICEGSNSGQETTTGNENVEVSTSSAIESTTTQSEGCPDNFIARNDRCYGSPADVNTWKEARTYCKEIDDSYDLVSIANEEENDFLIEKVILNSKHNDFWIGLKENGEVGKYEWSDSTSFEFGNQFGNEIWGENEPNAANGKTCIRIKKNKKNMARWRDISCNSTYAFICEGEKIRSDENNSKTLIYWVKATRHPEDKKFYYDVQNKEDLVNTESSQLYDEDENANCLTIEKNEASDQENSFNFRSSQCEEKVAYPICMIVKDNSENETTTVSSSTITTSTMSSLINDSSSDQLPTIDWSQVPCPSKESRKKRASAEEGPSKGSSMKQKASNDQAKQTTTESNVGSEEDIYYLTGIFNFDWNIFFSLLL